MPAHRLRAWLLAAFSLAIAFVLAVAVCFIGMVLSLGWVRGDPPTVQSGLVIAMGSVLIFGLISAGISLWPFPSPFWPGTASPHCGCENDSHVLVLVFERSLASSR